VTQIGEPVYVAPPESSPTSDLSWVPTYHLHLDADRDGVVDDDWRRSAAWNWGPKGSGAIVMCNDDDDEGRGDPDNGDSKVNLGNDKDELAPVVIRRVGPSPPGSWKGFLEVSEEDAKRVRVFDKRDRSGKEIIGPTAGPRYPLPTLDFTEVEYGIEALRFAGAGFDGVVELVFSIEDGSSTLGGQRGVLRVAPWMMPTHLDPALKVFVVNAGPFNQRFRTELQAYVSAAGCELVQHPQPADIWMQDCMEIGFHSSAKLTNPVVVRAPRDRELQSFPKTLLKPDVGYEEVVPIRRKYTSFDSTGNLEVTPPFTTRTGKRYPWGRIYYGPGRVGERMNPETKAFLHAQIVQAPIEVGTGWLLVGHVDEIISFVPGPGISDFKMLIASPRRAYDILKASEKAYGTEKMLIGRYFDRALAQVTIHEFLTSGITNLALTASRLRDFNDHITARLDEIRKQFRKEIDVEAVDFIEVPILYMPNVKNPRFADALTGGMVNMLVTNKHCIVPKPFGPVVEGRDLFEEDLNGKLAPLGLTVHFLDDWDEYHVNQGEVHCATSVLRRPPQAKWWKYAR
jgi:Protein-arginine deiminase (PAD)/Protein-arginine deiminase (PAD) middle domain